MVILEGESEISSVVIARFEGNVRLLVERFSKNGMSDEKSVSCITYWSEV